MTVLLPPDPAPHALAALASLSDVRLVRSGARGDAASLSRADLVHRPYQVAAPADLAVLAPLADRIVVTHHDLISYHNPSYFETREGWLGYRELTQTALAIADRVVFVSAHARDDAIAEDLIEPGRASVVHNGVDHRLVRAPLARPPRGVTDRAHDRELLLCLGTDFHHKNRLFALRTFADLRSRHGWPGVLVFAGSHVRTGSSRDDEQRYLGEHPGLGAEVVEIGPVSQAEKAWLLEHAALVVYPSVQEGFGLVPFEAADYGTPCLWAEGSSLAEVLPHGSAGIRPWSVGASADRAFELLRDDRARAANVSAIREAATRLRWRDSAMQLLDVYRRTCDEPPAPTGRRGRAKGVMSGALSEDAVRLLGPNGALPRDLERPLLALASHRRLAAPVFSAMKFGYAVSLRVKRNER